MTPEQIQETIQATQELYDKRKAKAIEYAKTLPLHKQKSYIEYINKELKTYEDLIHALENYDNLPKCSDEEYEDEIRKRMKPKQVSIRKLAYMGSRSEARAESIRRASLKYNF